MHPGLFRRHVRHRLPGCAMVRELAGNPPGFPQRHKSPPAHGWHCLATYFSLFCCPKSPGQHSQQGRDSPSSFVSLKSRYHVRSAFRMFACERRRFVKLLRVRTDRISLVVREGCRRPLLMSHAGGAHRLHSTCAAVSTIVADCSEANIHLCPLKKLPCTGPRCL